MRTYIPKEVSPQNDNRLLLYGGLLVVALGIVVLLAVVFALAQGLPSLFGQCVGVVTIDQELTTASVPAGVFGTGIAGSEEIAEHIRSINDRDDMGAVVFVINSPGGSVVATHEVYDAVTNISKPRVAYFREVAASGGYYIAAPMDYIVSDPDALTGSIGVVNTRMEMSGLFDKLGINASSITSGPHKDIGSPFRPMDEEERAIFDALIAEVFQEFKGVVLEHRAGKLDMERFEGILDGRVVSGRQAKEIGLVDALGTKRDAIRKAAELAGMDPEEVSVCEMDLVAPEPGLFSVRSFVAAFESRPGLQLRYG